MRHTLLYSFPLRDAATTCLTTSNYAALCPLCLVKIKSENAENRENTVQATTDTLTLLQHVIRPDSMKVPASTSLNSHCNQPFFTRMVQSFILLPKLLKAFTSQSSSMACAHVLAFC